MIGAVYDCMIFLQAAARPARIHRTIQLVRDGHVTLFLSPNVVEEVRDVLTRSELRIKFPALEPAHVDAFLNDILAKAQLVRDVPRMFSLPRDRKDEPYVDLAIHARAQYLVTWNERHLTYLMRRDTPEGREFCERFPHLRITDPITFIRDVDAARDRHLP